MYNILLDGAHLNHLTVSLKKYFTMEKREIPRYPKVPELSEKALGLLTNLCFRPDDELVPSDLLFVFGTPRFIRQTVEEIDFILRHDLSKCVVITGGEPSYEDSAELKIAESEQIYNCLEKNIFPEVEFLLEKTSRNTLENVTEGLKLVEVGKLRRVIYLYKAHDSMRGYLTLKKYLPEVELLQRTFAANYGTNEALDRDTWHRFQEYREIVWGEFLRIQLFGERGDIAYPEDVRVQVEKIIKEVS
jgi:hypothetical protein